MGGRISQFLAAEHRESKVVNRLGQLRADKVCPTRRESPRSKDFPRWGGLYAEVASRFTPSKGSQSSSESLEEIYVFTYHCKNRMKGDFCKWAGEFHNV